MCVLLIFPDLTLAMQKLYQTFVAEAAQLQSVHENVKVSSGPLTLSVREKGFLLTLPCFKPVSQDLAPSIRVLNSENNTFLSFFLCSVF